MLGFLRSQLHLSPLGGLDNNAMYSHMLHATECLQFTAHVVCSFNVPQICLAWWLFFGTDGLNRRQWHPLSANQRFEKQLPMHVPYKIAKSSTTTLQKSPGFATCFWPNGSGDRFLPRLFADVEAKAAPRPGDSAGLKENTVMSAMIWWFWWCFGWCLGDVSLPMKGIGT